MSRESRATAIVAAIYFAGVVLTFGWATHNDCADEKDFTGRDVSAWCGVFASSVWPAYVPMRISYEVFRP